MIKLLKLQTVLSVIELFVILPSLCFAGQNSHRHLIKNLEAPHLGITSTSVILIWDDIFEPDYQGADSGLRSAKYFIFQDGVNVGSTNKRTFTVKGL